ncbi:NAD-dependent protein deacylase [Defluviimonas aquaemixtae]|uniref:NAD-dependent protein deacylase n=1 Tax=Albidovulum aquaemixtae TaxID=1542388 RepID=A0A2R8B7U9_9RHOB|nr:NAD-dependent deacylase [Defluviimonas aquaemixtae]SPH18622.1 NAD-dependent protein deacylase [Defluviimonas aquaemixtae]
MSKSDDHIVILTGAGISAESGLGTFRDVGGLWSRYDWRDLATPEGFERDPGFVLEFYNWRRERVRGARPNAAHIALARLERDWAGLVTLVTQNVDDLHEQAGSRDVIHMHGTHLTALCAACGHRWRAPDVMAPADPCPACAKPTTRPDVVWFGEAPYHMDRIESALTSAGLFVSIGTSGTVYPAAGFAAAARRSGARTLELNLEPSENAALFDEARHGPAGTIVPGWVDTLLNDD